MYYSGIVYIYTHILFKHRERCYANVYLMMHVDSEMTGIPRNSSRAVLSWLQYYKRIRRYALTEEMLLLCEGKVLS